MPRERYVWDEGKKTLVPAHEFYARRTRGPRSGLPCPMIISDQCEVRSMADGKTYTSKAKYRASIRAHDCVEVGNDTSWQRQPPPDPLAGMPAPEQDVARALRGEL